MTKKLPKNADSAPDASAEEAELCVLVIDDEVGPRESIRILLKEKYRVLCADRVDAGIELLQQERPDLIIMDIRMPEKSGIEGLEEIRKIDTALPVIMLTGFGDLSTAQQALRHGASDYLTKPFDVIEMTEAVRRNLKRGGLMRRRAEAVRDLRRLNEELLGAVAESENMAEVGKRSAEIAHDIRSPLTLISGYVAMLYESMRVMSDREQSGEHVEADVAEYFEIINDAVESCRSMADEWRNGQGGVEHQPLDLLALARELVLVSRPLMESGRVTVSLEAIGDGPWTVLGNSSQLRRVIQNLFNNAIDAMDRVSDRQLSVQFKRDGDRVQFVVADTGCGMSEEVLGRVFDRYFTTKTADQGTGLSLTIAHEFVVGHKGSLELESEVSHGTRVIVSLPVAPDA